MNINDNGKIFENLKNYELVGKSTYDHSTISSSIRDKIILKKYTKLTQTIKPGAIFNSNLSKNFEEIISDFNGLDYDDLDAKNTKSKNSILDKNLKFIIKHLNFNSNIRISYDSISKTVVVSKKIKNKNLVSADKLNYSIKFLNLRLKKILINIPTSKYKPRVYEHTTGLSEMVRYNKNKFKYWYVVNNL